MLTMGGPRTSVQVLLLSAVAVLCMSTQVSAIPNTTSGPGPGTIENSNGTTLINGYQEACHAVNLQDASHRISTAVDTLARGLSCERSRNMSFPENKSRELEQNLRQIVESTLKVFFALVTNQSGSDALDIFGILDSLRIGNQSDSRFIRLWFSLKMAPFLTHVNENFLIQLSSQNFSCSSFQELIKAMSNDLETSQRMEKKLIYTHFIQVFLTRQNLPDPGCVDNVNGSTEWLKRNLGKFSIFASLHDIERMNKNFSAKEALEQLSLNQKAELILDPNNLASVDETIVKEVFKSLTESQDDDDDDDEEQLSQFFQAFANISKQRNVTFLENPDVRDTILNLTLTALAPEFVDFDTEDFQRWFQINLDPVIASIQSSSLAVIPSNISCASYAAILTGLQQSVQSLPLPQSHGVRTSIKSLKEKFTRCSFPDSFMCKQTSVDENLICAAVNGSQLRQTLSTDNSSEALCSFTITEHACSSATHLTPSNMATLLKCSLKSQRTYVVEVWKLFFQKNSAALDQALVTFATMASNNSSPSLSHALEALGEVAIANFSKAQLQSDTFVRSWFQTKIGPFLASPSPNFLFCLATKNFSCQTYQIVIQALSSQKASMDPERQQAVFTHFIQPFLSRNDSSDPGCVSLMASGTEWLLANLGNFSGFATLQDLQALNSNFSSAESLSALTPTQMAQLTLSSGAANDTEQIERVFEQLEEGNALENVDEFLTQLSGNGKVPEFQPAVKDRIMHRTFTIISPHFPQFKEDDWFVWFHRKLAPVLPSFSPMMLKNATSDRNCTDYHVIVSGMAKAAPAMTVQRRRGMAQVLLGYLKKSASVISKPGALACRQENQSDGEWLRVNLGPFSQDTTYSELKVFNLSEVALVDSLSANQKAELILDPNNLASVDETIVKEVFKSLTESQDDDDDDEEQLSQFFQAFANISKQRNVTFLENPDVRDTILNLTLTALAPEFVDFDTEDFQRWFQINLDPVIASIQSSSLAVIPSNISCASYAAILTGLQQSVQSLPLPQSHGVRTSIKSLKEKFTRCSFPDSFMCKQTSVDENLICAAVNGSQLRQTLSTDNSSEALCSFTITEHACSSATHLTPSNMATLLKCSLKSQRTYVVEVWKLFFQKNSAALDQALVTFATMAPNNSSPSLSHALEALGEVAIANFSKAQLQSDTFVRSWFQTKIGPFLASPSPNFLFCLATKNFSCQTYQIVIQALSSQKASMDPERQQAVFTHFIQPFLSRNDSSDPGCVSLMASGTEWLLANLGNFSGFAALQDLQALNSNFSSAESLSALTPTQMAQLTLSSGAANDTEQIERVFEQLEEGNALENVDEFLTQLSGNGKVPEFQPAVKDRIMHRTFTIISPHFPQFKEDDWFVWFHRKLAPVLPSFSPMMLKNATSDRNCTDYHVIVSGMAKAAPAMTVQRRRGMAQVLLGYLKKSASVISKPGALACRQENQSDGEWLRVNLGPFSQDTTYSELKVFNLSEVALVDSLSANQKAELILDPNNLASVDETIVKEVFKSLTESQDDDDDDEEQLSQFFQAFANISKQRNVTFLENPDVRDTILNLTLTALAPEFVDFDTEDFQRWFQINLDPVIASIQSSSLAVIPSNISCASYAAILTGLQQSVQSLPLPQSHGVRTSIKSLKEKFTRCSFPDSFMCKQTSVDEDLICAAVNGSQLRQTLSTDNSSEALCSFTITEHACSSATHLSPSNMATLLKCSLKSQRTYVVEVWKLFFQKNSAALDQALETFATMAPNNSSPSLSHALEALGEVAIANFSKAQLQSDTFVRSWFQTKIGPFLASPSPNFLFCLATKNFSCQTYQIVIQAFSSQKASMDAERQQAVFTHFIQPFLSRNDSSDPGCVSLMASGTEWLLANLGNFSGFATLQDLQALNSNFSSAESLSALTPTQMAQLTLSSGAANDTEQIERVFEQLEEGNALENVDEFLTQLSGNGKVSEFQPAVKDRIMHRTFTIISPHFPQFKEDDWFVWFHRKLAPVLPSFSPMMLKNATSDRNCTDYHVIVSGVAKAAPAMTVQRRRGMAQVLLGYLKKSASVISKPGALACRQENQSDAEWLGVNLGPFSQDTTYSELKVFNLSDVTVVDALSARQSAELLLEPNNLSNETLVRLVFTELSASSHGEDLSSFFDKFVSGAAEQNLTAIDSGVRDIILNLTLTALGPKLAMLDSEGFKLWFQVYLPLFLPSIEPSTFEIIPRNISCDSFQDIVKGCNNVFTRLSKKQTQEVFAFTMDYLKIHSSTGVSCPVQSVNDDRQWLESNFGQFRVHASFMDFVALKNNFNGVEVADLLTLLQLAQLAATPSQLQGMQNVTKVMTVINPVDFGAFFDIVSPAIEIHPDNYTEEVKSALLQAVFDRGNLSSPAINDTQFLLWLRVRLRPLLVNLSPSLVTPLFDIGKNRSCNSSQAMITLLNTLHLTLNNNTQREIYQSTLLFLQGPTPLKCYNGGSFFIYLRNTLLSFGFPDLSMFMSLLPQTRESELISSISTSELRQFLSQPNVIGNNSDICGIFNNYNNTPAFLETEDVPDDVKMVTLPCVWPLALSSKSRSEVNSWFDRRLRNYLPFLSKSLISYNEVQNASCPAFQKLVSVMGNNFTYNNSEFGQGEVFTTIKTYLRTDSGDRCYNASDAELNSTAWFANYIGSFVTFITLDDLTTFISASQTQVFLVDQGNLELFNNTAIPENVTDYYISQLFEFDPTFSPVKLPGLFLCSSDVPSSAYTSLNESDTILILNDLQKFCNGTENTEVSSALASNIQTITADTFMSLGSASAGLTSSQIASVEPSVLVSSLSTLSSVRTWNPEQATKIVQSITASGFQINNGSSLESLGTLVTGVPSGLIEKIPASALLNLSQSSTFVSNMLAAPTVVQQVFVEKVISVDSSPAKVVVNVPDAMATEIPSSLLVFSEGTVDISVINKKKWTREQATMFFGALGKTNFSIEQLSPSVLHGFTCTSVQSMTTSRIQALVRASRPRIGRAKVVFKESQLTCMYNLLNGNLSQNFTDYPSDMLLYYNNKNVQRANCRAYFSAVGAADFSVASKVLNKDSLLLSEAKTCLGISGVNLSRDNVEVLGNMACTLNSTYIENADPLILEKLKDCADFTDSQVAAMETLLQSGKTQYGNITSWNKRTLKNLGILPLYLTRNVWGQVNTKTKKRFLKTFMLRLRKSKTEKSKLKVLFKQISALRIKRGAGCTVGNITQVTVSDPSFPFGYTDTQFDLCLDVPVLKANLYSVCSKVDDDDFQKIILKKLNQAYPSGVADEEVQLLGSVSRVASLNDISKWNITKMDTLAALMNADDGPWEAEKSKAIITKYLNTSGNSLGSIELNSIDSNLCSLDNSTLKTITPDTIRNAKPLNVASCSSEQKRILYEISNASFSSQSDSAYYNLIKTYLGGASLKDVVQLSTKNINMGIDILLSLDSNVIMGLTVANMQGLMGDQLSDLKFFEKDAVIRDWMNSQTQSDLDSLGLGLIAITSNPTTAPLSSSNSTSSSSGAILTAAETTVQANTTSAGAELKIHPAAIFLAALLTTALQILQQPA